MKKFLPLAVILAVAAFFTTAATTPAEEAPPPKQVWVCHFTGHTADAPWAGGGTTLDGDYVLVYVPGGPTQGQRDYCTNHGGVGVIEIASVAAERGHDAQLLGRIQQYP